MILIVIKSLEGSSAQFLFEVIAIWMSLGLKLVVEKKKKDQFPNVPLDSGPSEHYFLIGYNNYLTGSSEHQ